MNRVVTDFTVLGESIVIDGVRFYMYTSPFIWGADQKNLVLWATDDQDALDQLEYIQRTPLDICQVSIAISTSTGSGLWGLARYWCRKFFYK